MSTLETLKQALEKATRACNNTDEQRALDALFRQATQPPRQPEPMADKQELEVAYASGYSIGFGEGHEAARAAPPHQPEPLTDREVELLDGMIEVQIDHAKRCESIANRPMAEKQKAWDMERVELLRKLKAAHGIKENT